VPYNPRSSHSDFTSSRDLRCLHAMRWTAHLHSNLP
jgi:hypothetical protein